MASRTPIRDFELANPIYKNATISWYTVANGIKTATLATLYSGASGSAQLSNPQKLNSRGQFKQPVYIEDQVIGEVEGISVPGHDTGIHSPAPEFRVTGTTDAQLEYSFDGGLTWNVAGTISPTGAAALVDFLQAGTGAVTRSVQSKERDVVSVRDFGAVGDGATDDRAAFLAAMTYAWGNSKDLFIPSGEYLISAQIRLGMTGDLYTYPLRIYGSGRQSRIKVTATVAAGVFTFEGPSPEVDGGNDRLAGRITLANLRFFGPERYGGSKLGRAITFYGAQGIALDNVGVYGFDEGMMLHNVDLATLQGGTQFQNNNSGIVTSNTGYAVGGQLNSFTMIGCWLNNNSTVGLDYTGGIKPTIIGNNFSSNGISLQIGLTAEPNANVECPTIEHNYFESDTGSMIKLGGSAGIVSGGSVQFNTMIPSAGTTAIIVGNIQHRDGSRLTIRNNPMVGGAVFTDIDQSTSAEKADYENVYAARGVLFPAAKYNNADPNALDDYEEGTWVVTQTGLTVTGTPTYTGTYTKVGNRVDFTIDVSSSVDTAAVAGTTFFNLPFLPSVRSTCVAADTVSKLGFGTGAIDLALEVYPPSWGASGNRVMITGSYQTAA